MNDSAGFSIELYDNTNHGELPCAEVSLLSRCNYSGPTPICGAEPEQNLAGTNHSRVFEFRIIREH